MCLTMRSNRKKHTLQAGLGKEDIRFLEVLKTLVADSNV